MTSNVSRWRWWWLRPWLRDQPQNLLEHLPCDGDLGHLEDNIAAVAHHLRADLDQLVLQTRQRPVLDRLRRRWPFQTLISCPPWVGLTLESMSSTMPRGGLRPCTRSIHRPDRSARAAKFLGAASHCVSKRPIWLGEAALLCAALPPTIQRIAGSWRRRSASFTSSYPARRPNTDCRNNRPMRADHSCHCVRRPEHHPPSQSSRLRRRVRDRRATQHRRSPGSRETGASSGGRNPAEQHPIPIHPLGAPWPPRSIQGKMLIAISESRRPRRNSVRYPVNAGLGVCQGAYSLMQIGRQLSWVVR